MIGHVEHAVAGFRAGELDAFEVDAVIHRYHRAAQRLWLFAISPAPRWKLPRTSSAR